MSEQKAAVDMHAIYENNEKFHEYIDKYLKNSGDTLEQALRKKIIKEIAKEYIEGGCNHREDE